MTEYEIREDVLGDGTTKVFDVYELMVDDNGHTFDSEWCETFLTREEAEGYISLQ